MKKSKTDKPTKAARKPCPAGFYRNKKGICVQSPDNFGYGDMPADFRKRYKEMLENNKK
tara:strand:- start:670 stop:846 length:177 start_codon:yes stop_codon:yes gene_type:complete